MLTVSDDSCSVSSVSTSPLLKLRQRVSFQVAMPVPTVQLATPEAVLDLAFSFRSSQALLTAVKLDIFTLLSKSEAQGMTSARIAAELKLHPFAATDYCDLLVSMKLLHRHGNGVTAVYSNTYESRMYLSKGRESYFGNLLLKCEESYRHWIDLHGLLKRGNKLGSTLRIGDVMERDIRTAKERVMSGLSESFCELSEADDEPFTWGLTVEEIFKIAYAFGPSKVVLSLHDMGLFTHLAKNEDQTAAQIAKQFSLDEKKLENCLAMLVGYKILSRKVVGKKLVYFNAQAAAMYLDKGKNTYIGGVLKHGSEQEYDQWSHLHEVMSQVSASSSLGKAWMESYYNHIGTDSYFQSLNEVNAKAFHTFVESFDFGMRRTMVDLGGGTGQLSALVAAKNKRIRCLSTDLPSLAEKTTFGDKSICGRVVSMGLNFFEQELPRADLVTLAHVFSECSLAEKLQLLNKAYDALPAGGALVVIDRVVDDERKHGVNELLSSLNVMLARGYADERIGFSYADFAQWITSVGFQSSKLLDLGRGSHAALIAFK
jgi:O-methyltransferase domain/Dimerisation domain